MENIFAKQKMIKDVTSEDNRVQITGYIKEINEQDTFILDDTTGQIVVLIGETNYPLKKKNLINVIGNLSLKTSGENILTAEIIQDMNNLDFNYYKELYELKKEYLKD